MSKIFFFVLIVFVASVAWGQTVGVQTGDGELALAGYGLPLILMVVLGVVYKVVPAVPDRYKALIAVAVGIGLGLVTIVYEGVGWNAKTVIEGVLSGLMTGAASVGLYEVSRTKVKPRS